MVVVVMVVVMVVVGGLVLTHFVFGVLFSFVFLGGLGLFLYNQLWLQGVMQRKLASMGVQTIVRSLALGDFLWFAKERVQPIIGRLELPESREVVLDHVIERKRMDDLVGSIMDGRFEEQKFRFANAEIKNGIYLIEDHGSINNKRLPATTLKQAIANTQVQGDFFVKHTADTASTIAYLVLMTRKIQDMFVRRCPDHNLFSRSLLSFILPPLLAISSFLSLSLSLSPPTRTRFIMLT